MIQYFPIVTGSLTVLGNINVSGSITTSGSITISGSITSASFASTASYWSGSITNASSASFAATASFVANAESASNAVAAQTASFVANAQTASYVLNAVSSSFASTASFVALAQSASNAVSAVTASFANNLTVAGTLTAQTLVVQTITSSVDFLTGSTRFGSTGSNTHQFTGSVSMTGSLAVVTNGTEFQVTSTGVNFGNVIGDAHSITGSVGISGSLTGVGANFSGAITANNNITAAGIIYGRTTNNFPTTGLGYYAIRTNNFDGERGGMTVQVSSATNTLTDALTINYLGAATFSSSVTAKVVEVVAGTSAVFTFAVDQQSTFAFGSLNGKRVGIIRDSTTSDNGLQFGYDTVDKTGVIAGAGTSAGCGIDFYTYNGSAWGNRMRVTKDGNVGIGTSSPSGKLMLYQSSAGNVTQNIVSNQGGATQVGINLSPSMTDTEAAANPAQASIYATDYNYSADIIFANKLTGAVGNALTERMRITSGGEVGIGATPTTGNRFWVRGSSSSGSDTAMFVQNSTPSTLFSIRNDGIITKPLQPSFRAGRSGNVNPGSNSVIIFNTTGGYGFNIGGNYSTSTGRFTAPIAGRYVFSTCVIWMSVGNSQSMDDAFTINVNGTTSSYSWRRATYISGTTGIGGYYTDFGTYMLNLSAGDYVTIVNRYDLTVHGNENYTWFAGYLVG